MLTIYATAGAAEYVTVDIVETTGQVIATDPAYLSLGSSTAPAAWRTTVTSGTGPNLTAKTLVGAETPPGQYYVWLKLTDSPEVPIRRLDPITVA